MNPSRLLRLVAAAGVIALLVLSAHAPSGGPANAQGALVEGPSVVVTGLGLASAPAETATIQVLLVSSGAFGGQPMGPRLTETDLAPVVDALTAAGIDEADIQLVTGPGVVSAFYGPGGPSLALVEAILRDPTSDGVADAIAAADEAATSNGLAVQQVGAEYDLADCASLLREARQAAIDNAQAEAEELAELVGSELGDLLQVGSSPTYFSGPPVAADDGGCPPSPETGVYGPSGSIGAPYDASAPVEARVYATVTLTYALGTDAATPEA